MKRNNTNKQETTAMYTMKRPIVKNFAKDYKSYALYTFETNLDSFSKVSIFETTPITLRISTRLTDYLRDDNMSSFNKVTVERERNFIMFYPHDDFTNFWNFLIVIALFYLMMFLPISLSSDNFFDDYPTFTLLEDIVNYLFMVDIIVNFNVAVYDDYNNLIDDYGTVACFYLQGWFSIDFFSSVPIDKILVFYPSLQNSGNVNSIAKFLRLPKYFRIFKLAKQSSFIKSLEKSEIWRNLLSDYGTFLLTLIQFVKGSALLLIACHLMSSVLMSSLQYDSSKNWTLDLSYQDTLFRYNWAWYWAFQTVTTVGYGDNSTYNGMEIVIKIGSMLIGVIVFSNFITSISADTNTKHESRDVEFMNKIDALRDKYMLTGKTMLILDQFSVKSKRSDMNKEWDLINLMPEEKKLKVFNDIQNFIGKSIKWIRYIDTKIFSDLFKSLEFKGFIEKEILTQQGQLAEYTYMVNTGIIGIADDMLTKYRITDEGYSLFYYSGDMAHVESSIMYQFYHYSVVCKENAEIFLVKKSVLIKLIEKYAKHNLWDIMIEICESNLVNYYKSKYAVLFILQWLYENGVCIKSTDIRQYKESNGLFIDHNMLYNFRDYTKSFKVKEIWYNKIIPTYFNFYIDYFAKSHVKNLKDNFIESVSRIKIRLGMHKNLSDCLIYYVRSQNKKCKVKNLNEYGKQNKQNNNSYEWNNYEDRRAQNAQKNIDDMRNFDNKKKDFDKAHNLKVSYWKETNSHVCDLKLLKDEYFNFIKLKEMNSNYHFLKNYMKFSKVKDHNDIDVKKNNFYKKNEESNPNGISIKRDAIGRSKTVVKKYKEKGDNKDNFKDEYKKISNDVNRDEVKKLSNDLN
eukprot:Mrub_00825.p1 GENE.Mrub_00825~~Mrub_00825.p1  ORF type:complete len:851 (-),score=139.32 Mrub_00825:49-2601(-)